MKFFLTLLIFMICNSIFAQSKSNCRVDIYLVKKYIHCWDTATKRIIPFKVTLEDLQDIPFIKDEEIVTYIFNKFRRKWNRNKRGKWIGKKYTVRLHGFETSTSVSERIDSLELSLFGCASQFAVVCDGEVVYGGCLNNHLSSWLPPMAVATGGGNFISLDFHSSSENDPRENLTLFDCLKSSDRIKYYKTFDDFIKIGFVEGNIIGHYRSDYNYHLQLNADSTFMDIRGGDALTHAIWNKGTWTANNDTIYFHSFLIFDTISLRSKGNQVIDSLILSSDEISERLTLEQYKKRGYNRRLSLPPYGQDKTPVTFKLFFKKQKIFSVEDGKLKPTGYFKTDR